MMRYKDGMQRLPWTLVAVALLAACPPIAEGEGEGEGEGEPIECTEVCAGDITIATASDFASVAACREITGTLSIQAPDVRDLRGLECVESVGGDLVVGGDVRLPPGPVTVSTAVGPVLLESLAGLDHLESVGGTLRIGVTFRQQQAIEAVVTAGPVSLATLDGAPSLTTLGGLEIGSEVVAFGDPELVQAPLSLTDLSALDGVSVAKLQIALDGEPVALPVVEVAPAAPVVLSGSAIQSVDGPVWPSSLSTLSIVATEVTDLTPLAAVAGVERLIIDSNPALTSLDGFDAMLTIPFVSIGANASLVDLSGLGAVSIEQLRLDVGDVSPGGALAVEDVLELELSGSSSALANLATAGSIAAFQPTSIAGLTSLTRAEFASFGAITDDDLTGLSSLTSAGFLDVGGALTSLSGLNPALAFNGEGSFNVTNAQIVDFTGLPALSGLHLGVFSNPVLDSLAGLEGVTPLSASFRENPLLAQCAIDRFLADARLPFDDNIASGNDSGNRKFCACNADGTTTCPDPRCTSTLESAHVVQSQADLDVLAGVDCAYQIYLFDGPTDISLPDLKSVEMIIASSQALTSLSLPALTDAGLIIVGEHAPSGALVALQSLSLPALTRVNDLRIARPHSLASIEAPLLVAAANLDVDCDASTPLTTLDLSSIEDVGSMRVSGCAALARCAIESDIDAAAIDALTLAGLNDNCVCDVSGVPDPQSC